MQKFKITPLSKQEQIDTDMQLSFIQHISNESIKYGMRTIIAGGYAVDGAIGRITRPHDDLDIQIYGKEVINEVLLKKRFLIDKYHQHTTEDRGRKEFYHHFYIPNLGAEIYYVQVVTNPFSDTKIVLKNDGKYTDEHDYNTKMVFLNGIRFEAQDAESELVDKLYKRDSRGDPRLKKHEQDIYNLRLITSSHDIDAGLKKLTT